MDKKKMCKVGGIAAAVVAVVAMGTAWWLFFCEAFRIESTAYVCATAIIKIFSML